MTTIGNLIPYPEKVPLGSPLPPGDVHAVGVHLPLWEDVVGWAKRDRRVIEAMRTGYPRFFVPRIVEELAAKIVELAYPPDRMSQSCIEAREKRCAIIFPCRRYAMLFLEYLKNIGTSPGLFQAFSIRWDRPVAILHNDDLDDLSPSPEDTGITSPYRREISTVMYHPSLYTKTKAFWQHTGFGISSRQATFWLRHAQILERSDVKPEVEEASPDHIEKSKHILRKRIAAGHSIPELPINEKNVLLYPTGMAALTEMAISVKALKRDTSQQCTALVFGFTYVDTYKTIANVLGYNTILKSYTDLGLLQLALQTSQVDIDVLFTEFPGNPLLQAPDIMQLWELSRKYNFILVVDDTVGTYINVNLAPYCDVICTSLTKMFSGGCNVMGGSILVSPASRHQRRVLAALRETHNDDDVWFPQDVFVMEQNSVDFRERVHKANANAEVVAGLLRKHDVVKEVYYPKGNPDQDIYDRYRRQEGRYGFLMSLKFFSPAQAIAFHDALDVAKGPSLGTNFTLCCAYTLLAHYNELDRAEKHGVTEHLVRISVGCEDQAWLVDRVTKALNAAAWVVDGISEAP